MTPRERTRAPARPCRAALSLVEAALACLVLLLTLPPLITAAVGIARADKAREERTHATALAGLVVERLHHHIYNEDPRGYRLDTPDADRKAMYLQDPPSYLAFVTGLAEPERSVVAGTDPAAPPQSTYLAESFARVDPARPYPPPADQTWPALLPGGLDGSTNPSLASDLSTFRLAVEVTPHPVASDPDLAAKPPEAPRVDLARVVVRVSWVSSTGPRRSRAFVTRLVRPVREPDPTMSPTGGP